MNFVNLLNSANIVRTFSALAFIVGLLAAIIIAIVLLRLLWRHLPQWVEELPAVVRELKRSMISWASMLKSGDFGAIADWFIWRFFWFGVVGIISAGLAAWMEKDVSTGMRVLAFSSVLGSASTASGWLLGLLFGVPRNLARGVPTSPTPQAGQPQTPNSAATPAASNGVNTNLEDISDWLTKTIVGVGLTQLYTVPHFLWKAADKAAGGFGWDGRGQLLALMLFVYFASGGFWLGYVGTRTVLTKLLKLIDDLTPSNVAESKKPSDLELEYSGHSIKPAEPGSDLAKADAIMLSRTRASLENPQQIAAWGAAQARAGNLVVATSALEDAHSAAPEDADIKLLLAKMYSVLGRRREAEQLGKDTPDTEIDVFNALYEPRPQGFEKAIRVGEALAAKESGTKSAQLHMLLACAYGQRHAYEKAKATPDVSALEDNKAHVLKEIQIAIAADPETKKTLRECWKPAPGDEDNDLTSFADDPDLQKLLEDIPSAGTAPAQSTTVVSGSTVTSGPGESGRPE